MATIDTVARAGSVALLTLIVVVLVRDRPRALVSWATVALCTAVASYLVISTPDYAIDPLGPAVSVTAGAAYGWEPNVP